MLRTTFLGHHGWLIECGGGTLLIDPLLGDRFGLTDAVELRAHPPRRFDFAAFPAVDAVFLTHEHEGHFDLPSLVRIARRIPIYLSARSSRAVEGILRELGFGVHLAAPGVQIDLGPIQLLPLAADQVRDAIIEEWDSLAYLVWERGTDNSLFANVDMPVTDAMWQAARRVVGRPAVWTHTYNDYSDHYQRSWGRPRLRNVQRRATSLVAVHERLRERWAAPHAFLVVGGGFAFGGERAWLNEEAFVLEGNTLARAIEGLLPGEHVLCPEPGTVLEIEDARLVTPTSTSAAVAPSLDRPSRRFRGALSWLGEYSPGTGRSTITEDELSALEHELTALATHLYGRRDFRGLCSLDDASLGGRKPTFALLLRADEEGGAYVFAYDPRGCRFVSVSSRDPVADFVAVFECWATDLLALLRGAISPTTLSFGRYRAWNACPDRLAFDLSCALFEYAHPLRHPERFLELYRRVSRRASEDGGSMLVGWAGA